jgi:hypothetical protein
MIESEVLAPEQTVRVTMWGDGKSLIWHMSWCERTNRIVWRAA